MGSVACRCKQVFLRRHGPGALQSHLCQDTLNSANALPTGQPGTKITSNEATNGAFEVCAVTGPRGLTQSQAADAEHRSRDTDGWRIYAASFGLTPSASIGDFAHVRLSDSSDKLVATPGFGSVVESPPAFRNRPGRRSPRESDVWPRLRGLVPRIPATWEQQRTSCLLCHGT